ncbi:MAG TPA: DUF4440 domain-containing protein [Allosphingosinicella sp.]|nr:DUF4440 domain-containing protein [Allosphingosinicella sp.]
MMLLAALQIVAAVAAPVAEEAARAAEAQRSAWNRGDLEAALAGYCDSAEMTWVARSGVTRGFRSFAEAMRQDFADPARMGRFALEVLDSRQTGPRTALLTVRWSIARDGERLMGGVSTQLWGDCQGRLRIVFEHAS